MKIALCISGLPRFYEKSYDYLYKNLIKNISNIDIFYHCWETDEEKQKKLENLFNPIKKKYDKEKIHVLNYPFKQTDSKHIIPNNIFSMFYSLMISNNLKKEYEEENNFTYDWVFRLRFDFALNKYFDESLLNELNNKFVYINNFEDNPNPHCADCFAFSSSKNMDIYSYTYKNIMRYGHSGIILAGENMLYHQLKSNNLELIKFDINHAFEPDGINYLHSNPHIKGLLCRHSLIRS